MKRNDILTIATVAIGTATLTLATFFGSPLDAGDESDPGGPVRIGPEIALPKLTVNGAEFTLVLKDGASPKPGEEPVFELTAANTTSHPASGQIQVIMTSMSPASALSRVAVAPGSLWQVVQDFDLKPKQTKKLTLASGSRLPGSSLITVSLRQISDVEDPVKSQTVAPQNVVAALQFSTGTLTGSPSQEGLAVSPITPVQTLRPATALTALPKP